MIVVCVFDSEVSDLFLKNIYLWANSFEKRVHFLLQSKENRVELEQKIADFREMVGSFEYEIEQVDFGNKKFDLAKKCDEIEASILIYQIVENKRKWVKLALAQCRELRIPYLLYKKEFSQTAGQRVLVPIGYLPEEKEKGQFVVAFAKRMNADVCLYLAKDYGTKAKENSRSIGKLLDKFSLKYTVEKADKDSFKVEKQALKKAKKEGYNMLLLCSTRVYGLDDIIFGAKEYHFVRKSDVPILFINPHTQLYAYCD